MDQLDHKILLGIFTKNPHLIIEKEPPKIEEQTVSRLENSSLTFNLKEKDKKRKKSETIEESNGISFT